MAVLGLHRGFPDSSVGKESACNAGYPGSISGLGRFPGEGKGYPLLHGLFSRCRERGLLFNAVCGLLVGVASLVAEAQALGEWAQKLGPSGSKAQAQ